MKKLILSLTIVGSSITAMAQTGYDVCETIRQTSWDQSNATTCLQIVSQNSFDPNILPVIDQQARKSTSQSLESLREASNRMFQIEATKVCDTILDTSWDAGNTTTCIRNIANNNFDTLILKTIDALAKKSTSESLESLVIAANRYFEPEAIEVCDKIKSVSWDASSTTTCIEKIADKSFSQPAIRGCLNIASSSTSNALSCIDAVAMDYIPAPIPDPTPIPGPIPNPIPTGDEVVISVKDLRRIGAKAKRAQKMIREGKIQRAEMLLEGVVNDLEDLKNSAPVY